MHDSTGSLLPYVAGFVVCVGAVFALVACTTPAGAPDDGAGDRGTAVVRQTH